MKVKVKCPHINWCISTEAKCVLLLKEICQDGTIEAELVDDNLWGTNETKEKVKLLEELLDKQQRAEFVKDLKKLGMKCSARTALDYIMPLITKYKDNLCQEKDKS